MNEPVLQTTLSGYWQHERVLLRRKILAISPVFQIFDLEGRSLLYCNQKLFRLKEDIRVWSDETRQTELLRIKARAVIDFSAAYDVFDATTDQKVGVLRRKGWSSLVRDEWEILDAADTVIGRIREDGMFWIRRLLTNLIPQHFTFEVGGVTVGELQQHFNPFVFKADLDLSADRARRLDRRLAYAAGLLLMAMEGRQQ
jgi:hypothetical protein